MNKKEAFVKWIKYNTEIDLPILECKKRNLLYTKCEMLFGSLETNIIKRFLVKNNIKINEHLENKGWIHIPKDIKEKWHIIVEKNKKIGILK